LTFQTHYMHKSNQVKEGGIHPVKAEVQQQHPKKEGSFPEATPQAKPLAYNSVVSNSHYHQSKTTANGSTNGNGNGTANEHANGNGNEHANGKAKPSTSSSSTSSSNGKEGGNGNGEANGAAVAQLANSFETEPDHHVVVQDFMDFDSMGLKENLLRGIYSIGYEHPSPIQRKAIVPCIQGHDVICQGQSGTGKTATFSTAVLERVDSSKVTTQAIILSPTRDLALQTADVIGDLSSYLEITCHVSIGGTNVRENAVGLRKNPHIVVGTPGRVFDSIQRGHLETTYVKMLVLDEMDVLLSVGFRDNIYDIFSHLPSDVQVILVSATMPNEALNVARKFMRNPVRIMVKKDAITLSGIRQYFVNLDSEEFKFETLCDLYEAVTFGQSMIFVNTIRKAVWLQGKLEERNFTTRAVHSNLSMEERNDIIQQFRRGDAKVLICTDVLARGIDVQGVSSVLNYDLPNDKENYIHRVGRCGRYGRKGLAINLITREDVRQLREIEHFYSTMIPELPADIDF